MPVFSLWSAPRARSTAFFRSIVERGDMVVVHEPFGDLAGLGETDVEGRQFDSPVSSSPGSLAALGCAITAVEPGSGMVALARQRLASFPNVEVETAFV